MNYIVNLPPLVKKHLQAHIIFLGPVGEGSFLTTCADNAKGKPDVLKADGKTPEEAISNLESLLAAREPEQEAS